MAKRRSTPSRKGLALSVRRTSGKRRKSGVKGGKDIMKLDAAGAKKLVKTERVQDGWVRQYRSTMASVARFFDDLKLRKVHKACLKTTPFYSFLRPFVNGEITAGSINGMQDGITHFLMTYNKDEKCFKIGDKRLTMEPREFDLIFGIRSGDEDVDMTKSSAGHWALVQRKFAHLPKVKPSNLRPELEKYLNSTKIEDIMDTCRIIIIYLLSSVFFIASGDNISGWMFRVCDDFMTLGNYNWGKAVVDYLVGFLATKKPSKVRGCTVFLQYWMCERLALIKPNEETLFPRFRKWKLKKMGDVLTSMAIKDIPRSKIRESAIEPTELEQKFLGGSDDLYGDCDETDDEEESDVHSDKRSRGSDSSLHRGVRSTSDSGSSGSRSVRMLRKGSNIVNPLTYDHGSTSMSIPRSGSPQKSIKGTPRQQSKMTSGPGCLNQKKVSSEASGLDGIENMCDDPREAATNIDDDAVDHVPISLWGADEAALVKKIARQEAVISQLDDEITKANNEVASLIRKAELLQEKNEYLIEKLRAAKKVEEERDADRADNIKLEAAFLEMQGRLDTALAELERIKSINGNDALAQGCVNPNDASNISVKTVLVESEDRTAVPEPEVNLLAICPAEPTFNLLEPTPPHSPLQPIETGSAFDDLPPVTDEEIRLCELVEKLATMSANESGSNKIAGDEKSVYADIVMPDEDRHPIHMLQDSDNEISDEPVDRKGKSLLEPTTGMARRTRSQKPDVTPVSVTRVEKKFRKCQPYRQLSDEVRYHVDMMSAAYSMQSQWLWEESTNTVKICIPAIIECLKTNSISNTLIDAYGKVLGLLQDSGKFRNDIQPEMKGETVVFRSCLMDTIRRAGKWNLKPTSGIGDRYRYVIFPLLHNKTTKTKGSDHWTVVVLDMNNGSYMYYNSLLPRPGGIDPYRDEAVELVNEIHKSFKKHGVDIPFSQYKPHLSTILNAPQQDTGTVDCGVAVMYVMKQYFMQKPIDKKIGEAAIRKMRTEVVETLVNWGITKNKADTVKGKALVGAV